MATTEKQKKALEEHTKKLKKLLSKPKNSNSVDDTNGKRLRKKLGLIIKAKNN